MFIAEGRVRFIIEIPHHVVVMVQTPTKLVHYSISLLMWLAHCGIPPFRYCPFFPPPPIHLPIREILRSVAATEERNIFHLD